MKKNTSLILSIIFKSLTIAGCILYFIYIATEEIFNYNIGISNSVLFALLMVLIITSKYITKKQESQN